ncbi:MAG: rane-associated oxidoreductase [Mycobacterium sp.]|nr:rane-associated oxidoreductase [Mycobacterium sp.]
MPLVVAMSQNLPPTGWLTVTAAVASSGGTEWNRQMVRNPLALFDCGPRFPFASSSWQPWLPTCCLTFSMARSELTWMCRLNGARFTNPGNTALDLSNSKITGSVVIRRSFEEDGALDRNFKSAGTIRLDGATIGGHLTLTSAEVTEPGDLKGFRVGLTGRCALIFDGERITGDVIASRDVIAKGGEVRGVASTIGGQLNLTGKQITNPPTDEDPVGAALSLDHGRITTDLIAETGFRAIGTVSAVGVSIGGNLKLTGASLTNPPTTKDPNRYALNLNNARITLSVAAGVQTGGAVLATNVFIGDQLSLGGARLAQPHPKLGVWILDRAEIGGHLNASTDSADKTPRRPARPFERPG